MRLVVAERAGETVVAVTLSRRNLLALLHKLDRAGSARTITSQHAYRRLDGRTELVDDLLLIVRSENDDEHYGGRLFPPGVMHPDTEAFISGSRG
ncbi:MAG: hypothetical protein H0W36_11550 [Gemmatimonadetes bacterium]|nr:hypothetical protein [Gemmatimonadota bacterium]